MRRRGIGLMLLLLVPPAFCLFSGLADAQAVAAQTSIYVFVPAESSVVRSGGIAGLVRKYSITGQLCLTIDFDAGTASFSRIDATLTGEDGALYAQNLDAIFNMAGLAGGPVDDTTIQFEGKTADGTESDVLLTLTLADDLARLAGKTTPPSNSADMFLYDLNAVAIRKYAGGTGEPDTPYLVGTPEQMNAIGAEPNDWDKHFKLIADIDLGGYRGTAYNLIAPANESGGYFTGLFDGSGHTISNFTYGPADANSVALFGNVRGRIENVGLIDPNIDAGARDGVAPLVDWLNKGSMSGCYVRGGRVSGNGWIGGLVAYNTGTITGCSSTTAVDGQLQAGGLTGYNDGIIIGCSSAGSIAGKRSLGGLVGWNDGMVTCSSSTSDVTGDSIIGGLAGNCGLGIISECCSMGRVTGVRDVAGLVGRSFGLISDCYSTAEVVGDSVVGGLVGWNAGEVFNCYSAGSAIGRLKAGGLAGAGLPEDIVWSFWDVETSGLSTSAGGIGKTTAEMQTAVTFLDAGWDFVGETVNGTDDIWKIAEGLDYPRLSWEQVLADDFEDGVALPLWQVYEPDAGKIWVQETDGRLEVRATEDADDINAAYISNGWRLAVTSDFEMKVKFHYGKQNPGDSWVMIALAPGLTEPISRIITFEAGCLDYQWFYLYEAIDGAWRAEKTSDRSTDDGTLYVSFNADKDELYLSYKGYGKPNAWRTVTGLLRGRWAAAPVYVGLGGGSDQAILDAADAYLDDFVIDSGVLQ